jgi:NADH:ubiquinone oxidoreductase subunit 6 (subunit J)
LLQSAPFLAAATIIVYAGAIIVTFLFVIMLAQQTGLADYDRRSREPLLACLAGFVLLTALLYVLQTTFGAPTGELAQTRLPEIKARLVAVNDLLLRQATKAEIDEAFNLEPQVPIGDALREELKRLPSLRSQVDALQQTIQHLGEARRNEDREEIRRWVGGLLVFADLAADPQKTAGQAWVLPVPADIRTTESSLSRDKSAHVTALGVSLFGDYLWAVELAGTLLLVATIGAIAIAQRARDKVTRRQREEAA